MSFDKARAALDNHRIATFGETYFFFRRRTKCRGCGVLGARRKSMCIYCPSAPFHCQICDVSVVTTGLAFQDAGRANRHMMERHGVNLLQYAALLPSTDGGIGKWTNACIYRCTCCEIEDMLDPWDFKKHLRDAHGMRVHEYETAQKVSVLHATSWVECVYCFATIRHSGIDVLRHARDCPSWGSMAGFARKLQQSVDRGIGIVRPCEVYLGPPRLDPPKSGKKRARCEEEEEPGTSKRARREEEEEEVANVARPCHVLLDKRVDE